MARFNSIRSKIAPTRSGVDLRYITSPLDVTMSKTNGYFIFQIGDYAINGAESLAPLLVVGIAGAGKSALMARCAYNATIASQELKIKLVDVE